jgi:hypothetical protein
VTPDRSFLSTADHRDQVADQHPRAQVKERKHDARTRVLGCNSSREYEKARTDTPHAQAGQAEYTRTAGQGGPQTRATGFRNSVPHPTSG